MCKSDSQFGSCTWKHGLQECRFGLSNSKLIVLECEPDLYQRIQIAYSRNKCLLLLKTVKGDSGKWSCKMSNGDDADDEKFVQLNVKNSVQKITEILENFKLQFEKLGKDISEIHSKVDSLQQNCPTSSTTTTPSITSTTTMPDFNAEPYFVRPLMNITANVGDPIDIHCEVGNSGDHWRFPTISFSHSGEILSLRRVVTTKNPRIKVFFSRPRTWTLHIIHARKEDEGQYQCQVFSTPPIVSIAFVRIHQ